MLRSAINIKVSYDLKGVIVNVLIILMLLYNKVGFSFRGNVQLKFIN